MTPEISPMDPALERAVTEIRDETPDAAVVEAAAGRVWARLAEAAGQKPASHPRLRRFSGFIPDYRAGRLGGARALLLKDHLNQCVACRRAYDGKVVAFPGRQTAEGAGAAAALRLAVGGRRRGHRGRGLDLGSHRPVRPRLRAGVHPDGERRAL